MNQNLRNLVYPDTLYLLHFSFLSEARYTLAPAGGWLLSFTLIYFLTDSKDNLLHIRNCPYRHIYFCIILFLRNRCNIPFLYLDVSCSPIYKIPSHAHLFNQIFIFFIKSYICVFLDVLHHAQNAHFALVCQLNVFIGFFYHIKQSLCRKAI